MADCSIAFDIQEEIIKRIPDVKSLVRFRSVSKTWKSVIHSPPFVNDHTRRRQHHSRHQLVTYGRWKSLVHDSIYLSVVDDDDDDSFCQQEVPTILYPADSIIQKIQRSSSSHGLVCIYPFINKCWETATAVIWNPAIRKSIPIDVNIDNTLSRYNKCVVGFGVCPRTLDPKLVKITWHDLNFTLPWQVQVYTLSSGIWRSINHNLLPRKPSTLRFDFKHVVVDHGFIYWLSTYFDDEFQQERNMIMSFDVTTEEFVEVYLPDSLATYRLVDDLVLSTRMDSLVVIEKPCYSVWKMEEHGVTKTFTNLFNIRTPAGRTIHKVNGFRNNGEPIIEVIIHQLQKHGLYAYEPLLGRLIKFTVIDIDKNEKYVYEYINCVTSYTETLLLLDQ